MENVVSDDCIEETEVGRWSRNMLDEAIRLKTLFAVSLIDGRKYQAILLRFSQNGIGEFALLDQPQSGSDRKTLNCALTFAQLALDEPSL